MQFWRSATRLSGFRVTHSEKNYSILDFVKRTIMSGNKKRIICLFDVDGTLTAPRKVFLFLNYF
jgi:hypothetical protein